MTGLTATSHSSVDRLSLLPLDKVCRVCGSNTFTADPFTELWVLCATCGKYYCRVSL